MPATAPGCPAGPGDQRGAEGRAPDPPDVPRAPAPGVPAPFAVVGEPVTGAGPPGGRPAHDPASGIPGPRCRARSKGSGSMPGRGQQLVEGRRDGRRDVPEPGDRPGAHETSPQYRTPAVAHDGDVEAHAVHHRTEREAGQHLGPAEVEREVGTRARWR